MITHLVVESTDVQGRVPRGVLSTHICAVKQQMLKVLDMTMTTRLLENPQKEQHIALEQHRSE